MKVLVLVGAMVVLVCLVASLNTMSYRQGSWYRRRLDGVRRWVKVRIHGVHSKTVVVRTTDGSFRVRPMHDIVHRVELVPMRDTDLFTFTLTSHKTTVTVSDRLPLHRTVFTNVKVDVTPVEVQPEWTMEADLEVTTLEGGGVLHSDRHGVHDVLLVPGKSSPFLDRSILEKLRAKHMRLHIVYYEDHTFARREGHIDCGFASSSMDLSLRQVREALRLTGARVCIGYSLGGLVLTTFLKRHPHVDLDCVVLINPFLAMTMHSAVKGLDTPLGTTALRTMRHFFPILNGARIIPRWKSRFDWVEYMAWKYPISWTNLQRTDPSRFTAVASYSFLETSLRAMIEIRQGAKIKTPVLLLGGTQDDICCPKTNLRLCGRMFETVQARTFPFTHCVFPGPDEVDDITVVNHIAGFVSSQSRVRRS